MTVDEAGFVAGQPHGSLGDIPRQARARDRLDPSEELLDFLEALPGGISAETEELRDEVGGDTAGRDTVHTYPALAELHGHTPRDVDDGGLRSAVSERERVPGPKAADAAGIDDAPRSLALHHRCRVFHSEYDPAKQKRHGGIEMLDGDAFDTPARHGAPGVVEDAVEAPVSRHRMIDCRLDVRFSGDVGPDEASPGTERLHEPPPLLFAPGGDHHGGAFLNEQLRGGATDTARPARYDRDLAIEPAHLCLLSGTETPDCLECPHG